MASTTAGVGSEFLVDYLGTCYSTGHLSPSQEQKLFSQMLALRVRVRPKVLAGDEVPYEVEVPNRKPGMFGYILSNTDKVYIDDQALPVHAADGHLVSDKMIARWGHSIAPLPPGQHRLRLTVTMAIEFQLAGDSGGPKVCRNEQLTLESGPFEVIPVAPPDYIKRINDPRIAARLRSSIKPRWLILRGKGATAHGKGDTGCDLDGYLEIQAPPANIAFDVVARLASKEYHLGEAVERAGRLDGGSLLRNEDFKCATPESRVDRVDIILRSNEKLARKTVDMSEMWEGELVIKDVPIETVTTAAADP